METKPVIHVVGTECPTEAEEKFDTWYSDRHVPDLLKFKKLKKVTRLKALKPDGEYPMFLTFYEFDDRQAFEEYFISPERSTAAEDFARIQKELDVSVKWSVQYETIKTWQR